MHMYTIEFHVAIFAWFMRSFGQPSRVLVVYHLERVGMPLHDAVGVSYKKRRNY